MIAYAMAKTSYSGEMVRNNGKVILTVPGTEIAEALLDVAARQDAIQIKYPNSELSLQKFQTVL